MDIFNTLTRQTAQDFLTKVNIYDWSHIGCLKLFTATYKLASLWTHKPSEAGSDYQIWKFHSCRIRGNIHRIWLCLIRLQLHTKISNCWWITQVCCDRYTADSEVLCVLNSTQFLLIMLASRLSLDANAVSWICTQSDFIYETLHPNRENRFLCVSKQMTSQGKSCKKASDVYSSLWGIII